MKKPKKVNFELIAMDGDHEPEPYVILREMRAAYHDETEHAQIALAWRKRQKSDVDGHLTLGKCIKVSDLYKEFAAYDFIIVLNREVWDSIEFTREKKCALIDHELCHATTAEDDDGERIVDERGRQVYRLRKHDIEEFRAIVARHGCYKRDLEEFAKTLLRSKKSKRLFEDEQTTVRMGFPDENGKTQYTEPVSMGEFSEACDRITKQ